MDLCVIDWKSIAPIIAALIASGTALYISNKWNKQKGSEVIANEAKQVVFDITELDHIFRELIGYKYKFNDDEVFKGVVNKVLGLIHDSQTRLTFILNFISNKDQIEIINKYIGILGLLESKFHKVGIEIDEVQNLLELLGKLEGEGEIDEILEGFVELRKIAKIIALYRFTLKK